jgi:general secretion pathway protein G
MKRWSRRRRTSGFTLMEVLLVLAILMILAGLAVVAIGPIKRGADRKSAKIQIDAYEQAAEKYRLDIGQLPKQLSDLMSAPADLEDPNKWEGPYLGKPIQKDPWAREYKYEIITENNNERCRIRSFGPNGVEGDDDDITNI